MASRRITRETFEAVVQDKVKRYRDAAGDSSMHRFKAHSRPPPRPRYDADGRFPPANSQHEDWSQDPVEEYPEENYPGPSYRPGSPLLRQENYFHGQFARPAPRERQFGRDYGRPAPQNREFGRGGGTSREYGQHPAPHSREYGQQNREYAQQNREYAQQNREYGRDRDYGQDYGPSDCWEGSHEAEFGSSDVLGDFRSPGLVEEEFGSAENQEYEEEFGEAEFQPPPLRRGGGAGRGRALRGKRLSRGVVKAKVFKGDLKSPLKKWNVKKAQPGLDAKALEQDLEVANQRPLQQHPKLPPCHPLAAHRPILRLPKPAHVFRNLNFDLVDKSDIFSTFGMEIIKWAGFHSIKNDAEFSRLFGALFELETETCAKMLASFKCSLRPEHRDYCFFTIKSLQHAALKTPKVDNEFLNMLLDKGAVKTKNCFFEIIKPFDKYIMRLQDRLLKGVTPLLMACNAYELSIKTNGFGNPREMANAFETTVSLCRKSLALLGQTFALASVFRQEKILEAVGLQEMAPAPTAFPNFDDSTLFGREYIENLKAWLEKSGYPIQMKKAESTEQLKAASPDSKAPQGADRKVLATIEELVSSVVSGTLSAKARNSPEYWFLADEESLEYKYYKLRLAEVQRSSLGQQGAAPASLRALLYARRVASIKRRLCKRKKKTATVTCRATRARRGRRASAGTQAVLPAATALKRRDKNLPGAKISLPGPGLDVTCAAGGATSNSGGVTCATGGATSNSGGVTCATAGVTCAAAGATSTSGGATSNSGGATSNSGAAATTSGGVTSNSGGVTCATGGATSNSGGATCVPGGATSAPGGATSTSGGATTTSGGAICVPGGATSAPGGVTCAPAGATSTSGGATSTSGGATSSPGGVASIPGGATSIPGGATCDSGGVTCAPGGVTCAPGGASCDSGGATCDSGGVTSSKVPEAAKDKADPEQFPASAELLLPLGSQFPDVDAKTMETAEKLAKFVAQVGPEIEQFSIDNSADNPDLWFLQDPSSPAFRFYRTRVLELCPSMSFTPKTRTPELSEDDDDDDESERSQAADDDDDDDDDDEAAGGRVTQLEGSVPEAPPRDAAVAPNPPPFPRKRVSSKSLPVGMIPASKRIRLIEEPKVHEPVRIAYDRPRGCPATKKKKKCKELEVLEKRLSPRNVGFQMLQRMGWQEIPKCKELEVLEKRLSPRNVGFQMLQRMGWQEGHGLGSRGRGIREPLHLGATSAGEGLGVAGEQNHEDAFDIFRQRMIQMYRQKRANK